MIILMNISGQYSLAACVYVCVCVLMQLEWKMQLESRLIN